MTPGEPSPWGPRSPGPSPDPYVEGYAGPWAAVPGAPQPSAPWGTPPPPWSTHVTDAQLRSLPPPVAVPGRPTTAYGQRPGVIALAVTLAVTGSMLWVCGLSLFLVVALALTQQLSPFGNEGYVFHVLDEAVLRMGDGLWVPLYGFPVASVVTGFLLLVGRPWTRLAHTAVGVASLAWAGWWLRDSLLGWFVVAVYVGTAVAVLWVPSVGRWYATRPARRRESTVALSG